jgi:hypothetical protein
MIYRDTCWPSHLEEKAGNERVKPLDMTELQHQAQSQHRYTLEYPRFRIRIQSGQWIRIQEGKNDPPK